MGGEKRTVESARENAVDGYCFESRPVSQSSEQPIKSARMTASWRVNGRSPVSFA
nr:MAG TPA: antimicrobial peptide 2 precursor [Bacteriophage sp.]